MQQDLLSAPAAKKESDLANITPAHAMPIVPEKSRLNYRPILETGFAGLQRTILEAQAVHPDQVEEITKRYNEFMTASVETLKEKFSGKPINSRQQLLDVMTEIESLILSNFLQAPPGANIRFLADAFSKPIGSGILGPDNRTLLAADLLKAAFGINSSIIGLDSYSSNVGLDKYGGIVLSFLRVEPLGQPSLIFETSSDWSKKTGQEPNLSYYENLEQIEMKYPDKKISDIEPMNGIPWITYLYVGDEYENRAIGCKANSDYGGCLNYKDKALNAFKTGAAINQDVAKDWGPNIENRYQSYFSFHTAMLETDTSDVQYKKHMSEDYGIGVSDSRYIPILRPPLPDFRINEENLVPKFLVTNPETIPKYIVQNPTYLDEVSFSMVPPAAKAALMNAIEGHLDGLLYFHDVSIDLQIISDIIKDDIAGRVSVGVLCNVKDAPLIFNLGLGGYGYSPRAFVGFNNPANKILPFTIPNLSLSLGHGDNIEAEVRSNQISGFAVGYETLDSWGQDPVFPRNQILIFLTPTQTLKSLGINPNAIRADFHAGFDIPTKRMTGGVTAQFQSTEWPIIWELSAGVFDPHIQSASVQLGIKVQ